MKKLLVALVALLIAASPAFAEEAKELNVFSWSEYIPQEVVNGFTKETGIKVVLSTYESNEAMYAKLKLLGAKGYDLVVPSGYFVEVMAQDNLLAKLDKSKIKVVSMTETFARIIRKVCDNEPISPEFIF